MRRYEFFFLNFAKFSSTKSRGMFQLYRLCLFNAIKWILLNWQPLIPNLFSLGCDDGHAAICNFISDLVNKMASHKQQHFLSCTFISFTISCHNFRTHFSNWKRDQHFLVTFIWQCISIIPWERNDVLQYKNYIRIMEGLLFSSCAQ
jgi:hypothetical protein